MTISHRLEAGMCKMESEKFSTFSKCRDMCSTCANIPYLACIINRGATLWCINLSALFWVWWLTARSHLLLHECFVLWQHLWVQMQWEAGSFIKSTCVMKAETLSNTQTLVFKWLIALLHCHLEHFKFNNLHSQFMH